jgi:hypothetical protein
MKVTSWSEAYNFIIGRREGFHVVRQQTSDTISMGGTGGGGVCMFVVVVVFQNTLISYIVLLDTENNVSDTLWHHVVAIADERNLLGGILQFKRSIMLLTFAVVLGGFLRYLYVDAIPENRTRPAYDKPVADVMLGNHHNNQQ